MADFDPGIFKRNMAVAKKSKTNWTTKLKAKDEQEFRAWVGANKIPFNPDDPMSDYDMRGFWKGLKEGDPRATTGINPVDGKLHFTDTWKTPYHKSFSKESQYATPMAGEWNDNNQLIQPMNGSIIFDERAKR